MVQSRVEPSRYIEIIMNMKLVTSLIIEPVNCMFILNEQWSTHHTEPEFIFENSNHVCIDHQHLLINNVNDHDTNDNQCATKTYVKVYMIRNVGRLE